MCKGEFRGTLYGIHNTIIGGEFMMAFFCYNEISLYDMMVLYKECLHILIQGRHMKAGLFKNEKKTRID